MQGCQEAADPKSSVTFLSFDCSGASLDTMFHPDNVEVGTGITGPSVGIEPTLDSTGNFANVLPAPTEQLNRALSGGNVGTPQRQVDALIVAGGMSGGTIMEGPYRVEFDRELPFDRGETRPIPGEASVFFRAPERRRSLRIPNTVYPETTDRNSPDFGRWQRGLLKVTVVRPPRVH